jgi:hypothetical protein
MRGIIQLICGVLILWLACPAHADPLDKFTKPLMGMRDTWNPPGLNKAFTLDRADYFTLTWSHSNIVRYKLDDELKYMLASTGPVFNIQHTNRKSWYSLNWLSHDTEFHVMDDSRINRLDGDRTLVDFEMGYIFPLEEDSCINLATRFNHHDLTSKGKLPLLFNNVSGLGENENSSFDWRENNWTLASHYNHDGDSIGIVLSSLNKQINLASDTEDEHIELEFAPSGYSLGVTATTQVDHKVAGQAFYRFGFSEGDKSVYRRDNRLGPLKSGVNSWLCGIRFYDSDDIPDWSLALTSEKSSTRLSGSADLTSFIEPVFGIVSPRAHLDAHYSLSQTSIGYEKNIGRLFDSNFTGLFGLTYWDMDCNLKTWESLLFGSAQINEESSYADIESGFLLHAGFNATWKLSNRDKINLNFGQSIPIAVNEREKDPGQPGLPHQRSYDGGRTVSISYIRSF